MLRRRHLLWGYLRQRGGVGGLVPIAASALATEPRACKHLPLESDSPARHCRLGARLAKRERVIHGLRSSARVALEEFAARIEELTTSSNDEDTSQAGERSKS